MAEAETEASVVAPSEGGDPMLLEWIEFICTFPTAPPPPPGETTEEEEKDLSSWQDKTPDDTGMGWLDTLDEQREEAPPTGDKGEKTWDEAAEGVADAPTGVDCRRFPANEFRRLEKPAIAGENTPE